MKLNNELFRQIVELLQHHMSENGRRALLTPIFFEHDNLFAQIDWVGDNRSFTVKLVKQLADYGRLDSGQEALVALLNGLREQVGPDNQQKIDALLWQLYQYQSTAPPHTPPTGRTGNPSPSPKKPWGCTAWVIFGLSTLLIALVVLVAQDGLPASIFPPQVTATQSPLTSVALAPTFTSTSTLSPSDTPVPPTVEQPTPTKIPILVPSDTPIPTITQTPTPPISPPTVTASATATPTKPPLFTPTILLPNKDNPPILKKIEILTANVSNRNESANNTNILKAIDDDQNTYWRTKSGRTSNVLIDALLENSTNLNQFRIYSPNAYNQTQPKTIKMIFLDGFDVEIARREIELDESVNNWQYKNFEPVYGAKSVILEIEDMINEKASYLKIDEMQFHGTISTSGMPTPTRPMLKKKDIADVIVVNQNEYPDDDYRISKAFDGDHRDSYWRSRSQEMQNVSMSIFFKNPVSLSQFRIYSPNKLNHAQPKTIELIFLNESGNEITRKIVWLKSPMSDWQLRNFERVDNVKSIVLRIEDITYVGATWLAINEFEFYGQ